MSDNIKVSISGVFPKADIDLIADYYGGAAAENKLDFAVKLAQQFLTDFLKAPTQAQIDKQISQQKSELSKQLHERVGSALSAEVQEI